MECSVFSLCPQRKMKPSGDVHVSGWTFLGAVGGSFQRILIRAMVAGWPAPAVRCEVRGLKG